MKIGNWKVSKELNEIYQKAQDLGLESNIAELDAYGFTVIENGLPAKTVEQLAQANQRRSLKAAMLHLLNAGIA